MTAPVTVLYIAGNARSGSTLLGSVLGELDGFVYGGELRHLWSRGLLRGWVCSCGRPVPECEFWSGVSEEALADTGLGATEIAALRERVVRLRNLPRLLRDGDRTWPDRDALGEVLARMYRAVASRAGARAIVDSSKNPTYGSLVGGLSGIEQYVVHLVRDPRAVAYSLGRRRAEPGHPGREMRRRPAAAAARGWVVSNLAARRLVRRRGPRGLVVRYEDFAARPSEVAGAIAGLVSPEAVDLPFVGPRTARLTTRHTPSGNPNRFLVGDVTIRADEEWRDAQRPRDRRVVTAITWPFLRRYGYPITPSSEGRSAPKHADAPR